MLEFYLLEAMEPFGKVHGIRRKRREGRQAAGVELTGLRSGWTSITGQGSGLSWDYFLMLAGLPGVKDDRMVRRFVARALGHTVVSAQRAGALILAAAERLEVPSRNLDYVLWRAESTR